MTWQADIKIWNRTHWDLRVLTAGTLLADVAPGGDWNYQATQPLDLDLEFRDSEGTRMQGRAKMSAQEGIYLDRGDLPGDQQPITLAASVPGILYTQSRNGGTQVLPPHQFTQGGTVEITFLTD